MAPRGVKPEETRVVRVRRGHVIYDVDMPTVESRLIPNFREPTSDNPGLVLADDGVVYLIEPDGTRVPLSGGSSFPDYYQLDEPDAPADGATWMRPADGYPDEYGVGAFRYTTTGFEGPTWQRIAPVALDDDGNVLGIISMDNDGIIAIESYNADQAGGSTVFVEPNRITLGTAEFEGASASNIEMGSGQTMYFENGVTGSPAFEFQGAEDSQPTLQLLGASDPLIATIGATGAWFRPVEGDNVALALDGSNVSGEGAALINGFAAGEGPTLVFAVDPFGAVYIAQGGAAGTGFGPALTVQQSSAAYGDEDDIFRVYNGEEGTLVVSISNNGTLNLAPQGESEADSIHALYHGSGELALTVGDDTGGIAVWLYSGYEFEVNSAVVEAQVFVAAFDESNVGQIGFFNAGAVYQQDATDGDSLIAALKVYGLLDSGSSWSGGGGLTGDGSPVGVADATSIGQTYVDTTNSGIWQAARTGTDNWVSLGGGGAATNPGVALSVHGTDSAGSAWIVTDSDGDAGFAVFDSTQAGTTHTMVQTSVNTLDDGNTGAASFAGTVTIEPGFGSGVNALIALYDDDSTPALEVGAGVGGSRFVLRNSPVDTFVIENGSADFLLEIGAAGYINATIQTGQTFVVRNQGTSTIETGDDGSSHATLGFFGATPIVKPSTPVTLADVIALIQAYGLSA